MSLTARERAVLDATAEDLSSTTPALAGLLAEGPELLRLRGVTPLVLDELVAELQPVTWRARLRRRLQPRAPRLAAPPESFA